MQDIIKSTLKLLLTQKISDAALQGLQNGGHLKKKNFMFKHFLLS